MALSAICQYQRVINTFRLESLDCIKNFFAASLSSTQLSYVASTTTPRQYRFFVEMRLSVSL